MDCLLHSLCQKNDDAARPRIRVTRTCSKYMWMMVESRADGTLHARLCRRCGWMLVAKSIVGCSGRGSGPRLADAMLAND
jgi:hypothetical protein